MVCYSAILFQLCFLAFVFAQNIPNQSPINQNINVQQPGPNLFTGTSGNAYYGVNLVEFGPEAGDQKVHPGFLTSGQTIDLYLFFPFYGGWYNYTQISVNGYLAFATVLDQGPTINVGPDSTDWPRNQDPAMIAPYLCKQQITQDPSPGLQAGVFYRLMMRQSLFGRGSNSNINPEMQASSFFGQTASKACPNTPDSYVRCDDYADAFLDKMMRWLQEGVAGANAFRADAALVVTWYNTGSAVSGRSDLDSGQLATYQAIWLTDQPGRLSYVIINYDKLGFDAADFRMNSRSGRCRALFNGGNHTGLVPVDPTQMYKNTPKVLAQRSGVPHIVRGRYMFRVDDVVRPAGCSNKTGGTYPMMIYPNIINMLGEMTIDINAMCLDRTQTYILMIEQRQSASCIVLNPSIARCTLPKIYDWGTKTLYFQPQSGKANDDKAFVGYVYFVPPTLDPMRLDIGNIYDWFKNPIPNDQPMKITWFPRNFTNPEINFLDPSVRLSDDMMYQATLGLYIIGYKEAKDEKLKKFRPEYRTLARVTTYQNKNTPEYRWKPQEERIMPYQVEQWYLNDWERMNELYTYRFGFFKLAPIRNNDQTGVNLLPGLVSAPVSLQWLWTSNNPQFSTTSFNQQDEKARVEFVEEKARQMCHDWYDEDGALWNFIRDTETNASCPCIETQARMDIGRFMPHPRCSQEFRDITCTEVIGARNCYMSAQNVYSSYMGKGHGYESYHTNRIPTHYGQVCCYDAEGFLMQSSYQPTIKIIDDMFYNPGFPMRAYEFGASPYLGQFEVPGLSAFHHDYMPYHLCCKFAKFRCQLFYWRRPSSGCQTYQPPAIGYSLGAGTYNTIDNEKFIFNDPGVYTLLYIPKTKMNPEVRIQIRTERYPDRRVDFSLLGRQIGQEDLVQPSNMTVITGIAIEATGTDRVHIMARGDTRRFRYRTSIVVGNILRYFDTMRLQRFKGVLIYVNNVERGQPDIYVVLEEAEIGIRIRESYALDIDRLPMFQESMGMLDISLSVPPRYGVRPDGDKTREMDFRQRYELPRVEGLMRPFPDDGSGSFQQPLTLTDVNPERIRQQVNAAFKVPGTGGFQQNQQNMAGIMNRNIPMDNMFMTSKDSDKQFEVFPEVDIVRTPIYKTAEKWSRIPFEPKTGPMVQQLLQQCRDLEQNPLVNMQPMQSQMTFKFGRTQCPDNPSEIIQVCGDSVSCLFDYFFFNSKILGLEQQNSWGRFVDDRHTAVRQYNSCGPINIEYPEYLHKISPFASAYLQGDVATFGCFQTHWIKGDYEYKCGIKMSYNDPNNYGFEWEPKGYQPWCRSRELDNFFKWITAIFSTLAFILAILVVFLFCWCAKQSRRKAAEERSGRGLRRPISPPFAASRLPEKDQTFGADSEAVNQAYQPSRASSPSDLRSRTAAMSPTTDLRNRNASHLLGLNTSV
ncbi:hypothetical protein L596_006013 [Steinernema carpocapsae]|uniref:AMOP domain-containing protein n=1 Tax=Steinernema carpocapsae TaxID=34508 RepID=A0A4U8V0U8_STECR|nr:hypothetical protein L596_006013 [Steinernema carpocapsae]